MESPSPASGSRDWSTWLLNPFHYLAGSASLLFGVTLVLATGLVGSMGRTHFDGVLDFHTGPAAPLWIFLAEGLVDWLTMGVLLLVAAFLLVRTRFRIVDVLGTQALARAPGLVTAAVTLLPGYRRSTGDVMAGKVTSYADLTVWFYIAVLAGLLMVAWMVLLMYRGFAVSCNVRGGRAIASFIVTLIIAEVASKVVMYRLISHGGAA